MRYQRKQCCFDKNSKTILVNVYKYVKEMDYFTRKYEKLCNDKSDANAKYVLIKHDQMTFLFVRKSACATKRMTDIAAN